MKRELTFGTLVALMGFGLGIHAGPALAGDEQMVEATDVTVVANGEGASRVLFRLPTAAASEHTVVKKAVLTIPFTGSPEERSLELRVCPVTDSWLGGGSWATDFDADLYAPARADFGSGSGTATFDLTVLLKEILEDSMESDGYVLTTGSQDTAGLAAGDAERFSTLEGAELRLVTTVLPTGRPGTTALRR